MLTTRLPNCCSCFLEPREVLDLRCTCRSAMTIVRRPARIGWTRSAIRSCGYWLSPSVLTTMSAPSSSARCTPSWNERPRPRLRAWRTNCGDAVLPGDLDGAVGRTVVDDQDDDLVDPGDLRRDRLQHQGERLLLVEARDLDDDSHAYLINRVRGRVGTTSVHASGYPSASRSPGDPPGPAAAAAAVGERSSRRLRSHGTASSAPATSTETPETHRSDTQPGRVVADLDPVPAGWHRDGREGMVAAHQPYRGPVHGGLPAGPDDAVGDHEVATAPGVDVGHDRLALVGTDGGCRRAAPGRGRAVVVEQDGVRGDSRGEARHLSVRIHHLALGGPSNARQRVQALVDRPAGAGVDQPHAGAAVPTAALPSSAPGHPCPPGRCARRCP